MAHFAQLDGNNIVTQVIVVGNDDLKDSNGNETESIGVAFCQKLFGADTNWKQTSYNNNMRGNYAGIGYHYLPDDDIFLVPPPYDYFVADVDNFVYIPPVEKPDDGKNYVWNDDDYQADNTQGWVVIEEPEE